MDGLSIGVCFRYGCAECVFENLRELASSEGVTFGGPL